LPASASSSDGYGLVGDEFAAASEMKLQLEGLFLTCSAVTEVWSHPRLLGKDAGAHPGYRFWAHRGR
jgi:hypothetical protein